MNDCQRFYTARTLQRCLNGSNVLKAHKRTDVDDVSLAVDHDVAVVAVLDLQQEGYDAVCRHAHDEVASSLVWEWKICKR